MTDHALTSSLAEYVLNEKPDVGDQFIVRVLHRSTLGPASLRVYIRREGQDCETMDFDLAHGREERV